MKTYEQHEKSITEIIQRTPEIKFISQIFAHYKWIKMAQFYNLGLEKSESIKKAIEINREVKCNDRVEHWLQSENPTLQLAGYRLICSDADRDRLATSIKADAKVDAKQKVQISFDEEDGGD